MIPGILGLFLIILLFSALAESVAIGGVGFILLLVFLVVWLSGSSF